MAKIKVGIVEDDMLIADGIVHALTQLGYDSAEPAISYTDALLMIEKEQPDILLLDIQLSGKKDGIDLAWKIKEDYNIPFIFLTANADAATVARAKKVTPPAYLVKPFNKDELYSSIEICLYNYAQGTPSGKPAEKENYFVKDSLFIKQGSQFVKVRIEDIMYLESDNVYIHLYTQQQKLLVRSTLQQYIELIGAGNFFRVHRSYAININYIDSITADSVLIKGAEIPIGKAYRDQLLSFLRLG